MWEPWGLPLVEKDANNLEALLMHILGLHIGLDELEATPFFWSPSFFLSPLQIASNSSRIWGLLGVISSGPSSIPFLHVKNVDVAYHALPVHVIN
jgi:hypothetical protein